MKKKKKKLSETPDAKSRGARNSKKEIDKGSRTCTTRPGRDTQTSGKRYPLPPWKRSGLLLSLLIPCSRCKSSAFVHTATFPFAKRKIPRGLWGRRGGDDDERNDGRKLSPGKNARRSKIKGTSSSPVYVRRLYKYLDISVQFVVKIIAYKLLVKYERSEQRLQIYVSSRIRRWKIFIFYFTFLHCGYFIYFLVA